MPRKMKESGVEWLGQIPERWEMVPNKHVIRKKKVICSHWTGQRVLSLSINGVVVRDLEHPFGKMPTTFDGYQFVDEGNLLMCLFDYDVTPRCVGRCQTSGVTSPAYSRYEVLPNASMDFVYYYYLMVDEGKLILHLARNLRHAFSEEDFGYIKMPLPPLPEQERIAAFLDERCAKIDGMIAEAKTSIEDYKKWKQSIIFEAVTGKHEKNLKPSGVDWIGDVPEGWKVTPIKYLLTEINHRSEKGTEEPLSMSQQLGIVPSSMINVANPASTFVGAKIVGVGDLVFNKLKAHLGVFAISKYEGLVSPDYAVYRSTEVSDAGYLNYLFHSPNCVEEFKRHITGVGQGLSRLYTSDLFVIKAPLPSLGEQRRIAAYLYEKCAAIDKLVGEKESLIADLGAYKKSLIFEAVTGKREVA